MISSFGDRIFVQRIPKTKAYVETNAVSFLFLVTGLSLVLIKFIAYFITGSRCDFLGRRRKYRECRRIKFYLLQLLYLSARAKDNNHAYGRGKVEFFSVFVEGGSFHCR